MNIRLIDLLKELTVKDVLLGIVVFAALFVSLVVLYVLMGGD